MIVVRPSVFLIFRWLPRCETNRKPRDSRMRMISAEPSRLGMDEFLPDLGFANEGEVSRGCILEIQLDSFAKIGERLGAGLAEAGHVHIQALRHKEFLLAIDATGDGLHGTKVTATKHVGKPGGG